MKVLSVSGHRPQTLNKYMDYGNTENLEYFFYYDELVRRIIDAIKSGYSYFISGGAVGVDMDFAEVVLKLKSKYPHIKLEIAVPCKNQNVLWREKDKLRYEAIIKNADKVTYISEEYYPGCMQKRNRYLVESADKVLIFWNGESKGGTYNSLSLARKFGKELEIVRIDELN